MAKTILTAHQLDFLELAATNKLIVKDFYLTGGTALTEFYYKHRLSEDIDLFCESHEISQPAVEAFLQKISPKLKIKTINRSQFLGLVSYILNYDDGQKLKVDFNYYPFLQIDKGKMFKSLRIDSVYDIAANKIHTLFMRPRLRDYIDLYYIFQKENYSLPKLIIDAKIKFDWHIDPMNLASQFLRCKEFFASKDLPAMLISFDKNVIINYYNKLAKGLDRDIFMN